MVTPTSPTPATTTDTSKPPRHPVSMNSSGGSTAAVGSPTRYHLGGTTTGSSFTAGSSYHQRRTSSTADSSLSSIEELLSHQEDQAERGLLHSMEQRRSATQTVGGDPWHAAVQGERPPLGGAVPCEPMIVALNNTTASNNMNSSYHQRRHSETSNNSTSHHTTGVNSGGGGSQTSQNSATKLADIARRMRQKSLPPPPAPPTTTSTSTAGSAANISVIDTSSGHISACGSSLTHHHRRAPSRVHALLDSIQEQPEESNDVFDSVGAGTSADGHDGTAGGGAAMDLEHATNSTDRLITGAMQVEDLFDDTVTPTPTTEELVEEEVVVMEDFDDKVDGDEAIYDETADPAAETVPLVATSSSSVNYSYQNGGGDANQSHASSSHKNPSVSTSYRSPRPGPTKTFRVRKTVVKKKSWWHRLRTNCCHPLTMLQRILHLLWYQTYIVTVALPCFVTAAILYYGLTNPLWNFLPGHASIAWWCNFVGRQILLLEVARVLQWCFIDKLVLGTRIAVQCLGPLLTLCLIQAWGWPFCIAAWGFLDLLLLEGSSDFERHWLFFTEISLYSQGDSGSYVLSSEDYVRLLLSMILAGFCTAIKRTAVAMYFGRRTFVEFKPRLEKLLKEVVLVFELAALAAEAEIVANEEMIEVTTGRGNDGNKVKFLGDVSWNNKKKGRKTQGKQNGPANRLPVSPSEDVSDSDDDDDDEEEDDEASEITTQHDIRPDAERFHKRQSNRGSLRIKELLEHWEEPINKADKSLNASISDILRFRRALTFMDDSHPFGDTFGPANNRDQLITSAHSVYQRLLMLTPGRNKVSCEFYDMLSLEDDGETVNHGKRKALLKLFRPDANNELSLLAFVQSCDSLYKKLRYFRANVGNASVIDHALESIVDGGFSFVLILVLLSVMRINPWPLLVSISTLLVSISFAVGSSASKWFEGMLLVAARRPYDLGDRIYMTDPSLINSDGLWYCWFIEDINLFHTTIRYAGTNEVATINNGSVANMRIINGARSPNAAVWFQFPYRPNLMEDGNMDKIKAALEDYARENPRSWHSFSYFRVDEVHPHLEKLVVTIGMNHRGSWQDLVGILQSKADCMCWLMEYSRTLGVIYDELPRRDLMYYAGALKEGGVRRHRFQLHDLTNIKKGGLPAASESNENNDETPTQTNVPREASDAKFLEQLMHSHG